MRFPVRQIQGAGEGESLFPDMDGDVVLTRKDCLSVICECIISYGYRVA
jgi:hypothetical protein